ncbi:peptidoglycan editing factor PgeF [Streptomyces sp. NPDC057638]|uniref:peptidoglycan editing factor PgeF n=1 Tax=Streptomyces sp. NPDC057638 TaxID=3346190 RepID=UPI0036A906BB
MTVRHDAIHANGAHFAFTTRWGGVSAVPYEELNLGGAVGDDPEAVLANRRIAAGSLGLDPARVVWMNQVHGNEVATVDRPFPARGAIPAVDGVVSAERGLALAVLTADCVPVLLADPVAGVVGAAHAGRPGMVAGIVPATVKAMVSLGAEPERMTARTGPSVCGRCYEVPEEMRTRVAESEPAAYAETRWGTPAVDVAAGVHAQLASLGVRDRADAGICTLESADHYSYRRDRTTGRLAGYVWLSPVSAGETAE